MGFRPLGEHVLDASAKNVYTPEANVGVTKEEPLFKTVVLLLDAYQLIVPVALAVSVVDLLLQIKSSLPEVVFIGAFGPMQSLNCATKASLVAALAG